MSVQVYLTALRNGVEKGLNGKDYLRFAERIFSKFLSDLSFGQIYDAVAAKDETASLCVFKKMMKQLLRETGTDENHYLMKQQICFVKSVIILFYKK